MSAPRPVELVEALHDCVHEEPGTSRPAKMGRTMLLTMRARINLADLERHVEEMRKGGTGEGVALAGALSVAGRNGKAP